MNFRGTKIFDEYNEDEFSKNNNINQRISISKYMEKDSHNMNMNMNYIEQHNNNFQNEESFADNQNHNNNNQKNFNSGSNNNLSDKISIIKILISNYLKEKELDT